jgi:hypothetical protein
MAPRVAPQAPLDEKPDAVHIGRGRWWPVRGSRTRLPWRALATLHPHSSPPHATLPHLRSRGRSRGSRSRRVRRTYGARDACPAVPQEQWLAGQAVYRDCSVDRPARQVASSPIEYPESGGQTCVRARIEAVVDTSGRVVPSTARIIRSNDPVFAAAVTSSLDTRRFEPAQRNGKAVPQIVHIDEAMELRAVVVRMGDPLPRGAGRPSC